MARPNVPKFGDWDDTGDDVPYTSVFNEARKNRVGSKMINPNDPQENPEAFNKPEQQPVRNSPARQRPVRPPPSKSGAAGSDRSFDKSPLHPQARVGRGGAGSASPARDPKSNADVAHGTPGRSRLRPATPNRGDESPDNGAAVPRFGEWDENDPRSAENFTHIFDKVREERSTGAGKPSGTPRHPSSYEPRAKQQKDHNKKCCFPWW